MNTEKKTFAPAEVEIIRFDKKDEIATDFSSFDASGEAASGFEW